MAVKLKKSAIRNFAGIKSFDVVWDQQHTKIIGRNGKGKSTVGLTSIWAAIKGVSQTNTKGNIKGQRFHFIGPDNKSADITLTFIDTELDANITIKRHLTKDKSSITFHSDRPDIFDKEWLNNFLSVSFLSARHFMKLTPQQQALELGIDTSEYNAELKSLKQEFTFLNREYNSIPSLEPAEKAEEIALEPIFKEKEEILKAYYTEKDKITEKNKVIEADNNKISDEDKRQIILAADIERKAKELSLLKEENLQLTEWLHNNHTVTYYDLPEEPSLAEYDERISQAQSVNKQAFQYTEYVTNLKLKEDKSKELKANKLKQTEVNDRRLAFINKHNFRFEGLSVDDEGGLLLNDRPIQENHFSHAESEMIVAKLHASLIDAQGAGRSLRFRFLDDFDLLDEDNQTKILQYLFDLDFQVATAHVGVSDGDSPNIISLSEPMPEKEEKPSLI